VERLGTELSEELTLGAAPNKTVLEEFVDCVVQVPLTVLIVEAVPVMSCVHELPVLEPVTLVLPVTPTVDDVTAPSELLLKVSLVKVDEL